MSAFLDVHGLQERAGVAFVGNYLPRRCGIATFTHDLAEAVADAVPDARPVTVVAVNDRAAGYNYPNRVRFTIEQERSTDYMLAAEFINFDESAVVCLQHEFGIFGGLWGSNVLSILRTLRKPVVTTCHTVDPHPDPLQKEVFQEVVARSARLVVMNRRATAVLEKVYRADGHKIVNIRHGIHDVPFVTSRGRKRRSKKGRVLLTFGLLHRNKGIEHMIDAMPEVVRSHPHTVYMILGATHPRVIEEEGQSYRRGLRRRARDLGVENNVVFLDRFLDLNDLLGYLRITDIFVAPYLVMEQMTSGVLAYAAGAGNAIVSTPFLHALELLANGRGRIVAPHDPGALAKAIVELFDDEAKMDAMRRRAYDYSRPMIWQRTAEAYIELFDTVSGHLPRKIPIRPHVGPTTKSVNLPR